MNTLRNLALGAVALAASLTAHAAAFQNGSFESGSWPGGPVDTVVVSPGGTQFITGWTSYGLEWNGSGNPRVGDVAWLNCPGGCWTDLNPADGDKFVDLTGYSMSEYGVIY